MPVLEDLLGLAPGVLTRLVGPRRQRRRGGGRVGYDEIWRRPDTVGRALAKLGATFDDLDHPLTVAQHLSYQVDGDGCEAAVRVRRLLLADRETRRFLFVTRCSSIPRPPVVTFADGCRQDRFRADAATATCAFEFVLERPLHTGDLAAVEFALAYPPGQAARHAQIAINRPVRTLVLEVTFDPHRLPARCFAFRRPRNTSPAVAQHRELLLGGRKAQFVALDPLPGQYGIAWQWDTRGKEPGTPP